MLADCGCEERRAAMKAAIDKALKAAAAVAARVMPSKAEKPKEEARVSTPGG